MSRKFGTEFELCGLTHEQAARALRLVGVGVHLGYSGPRNEWKVIYDGSVANGCEVVSPILEGEAGLEQVRAVVTALDDMGGKVDRRCGYHVHFDAADLSLEHIRAIVTRYAAFENEIDAFMPHSRRGGSNNYCRSLASVVGDARFGNATTLRALVDVQPTRYFKVNLKAYHEHGTIEFRQHSGTLNAPKAVNWICLLEAFIADTKAKVDSPASAPAAAPVQPVSVPAAPAGLTGVNRALHAMLQHGPVAIDAMCQQFGWQPHTARAAVTRLRRAGFTVTAARSADGLLRYALQGSAPARRPALVSRPADSRLALIGGLYDGVAEFVRIFYRNRTAVLAYAA